MPVQLLFDATVTCSPGHPPSRVEARCPHISSTPSYVLYLTGQANLFLSASFIPVPSKPNSAESVTSQARGLFLSTPQSLTEMGLGCWPATSHPIAASLNHHRSPQHLQCSVLDLSGTSSSHLAEKGDANPLSAPCHARRCKHAYKSTHAHTPTEVHM